MLSSASYPTVAMQTVSKSHFSWIIKSLNDLFAFNGFNSVNVIEILINSTNSTFQQNKKKYIQISN